MVLTSMSQSMARQCVHDSIVCSLPGRCPSRPGAIAGGAARAALSGGAGEGVRVSEPWGDARRWAGWSGRLPAIGRSGGTPGTTPPVRPRPDLGRPDAYTGL